MSLSVVERMVLDKIVDGSASPEPPAVLVKVKEEPVEECGGAGAEPLLWKKCNEGGRWLKAAREFERSEAKAIKEAMKEADKLAKMEAKAAAKEAAKKAKIEAREALKAEKAAEKEAAKQAQDLGKGICQG